MTNEADALVMAGNAALEAGDWASARDSFRGALDLDETAEALYGLGEALCRLGEINASVAYKEQAYAAFRHRPDPLQAVDIALRLCIDYRANLGNSVASAGWLARAARLVEEFDLDDRQGWLLLIKASDSGDPALGEAWARQACELARRSGDLDLELCALSQIGAALVEQGRVEEGVAWLDEAMAGSLGGEGDHFDTVVFTSCNMLNSCAHGGEFERAVQWIRAADRFTKRYGCPYLYAVCRTDYGSVLLATGDWSLAEAELKTAVKLSQDSLPALHGQALATLASLRLALVPNQVVDGLRARILRLLASKPQTKEGPSCHMLTPVSRREAGRSWSAAS